LDDVLEALVEGILHDFREDVANGAADLVVDPVLHILLGVCDVMVVALVFEDAAVALLIEIKEISSVNKVAVTGINWVIAFFLSEFCAAVSLIYEARCFTKAVLLAVEFRDTELSLGSEMLSIIARPGGC
jgi:hypothetical protein